MKPKSIKILYWTLTVLFVLASLADAFGGITEQEAGRVVVVHLGYPVYILRMFGIAKLLGAIAIIQPMFKTVKEWAYAGFAFTFICAIASRAIVGDGIGDLVPPAVMLIILFVAYFFWKKYESIKTA